MNKEKLFKYYIRSGFISDEELYGLGLSKFDSIEPQIKNLPNPVIISDSKVVTTIEDTYEEYGILGGKSEYIAFEMQFGSMEEVVDYVIRENRYETVDITINANGNNGKNVTTTQTVQFINDNVAPTIGTLPTPVLISDSKIITTIQDTYEAYGEAGGTSEYVVFDTKFSSMKEVVDYVIENSKYETVEITINANGNNAKNVTSTQTVQFIEDSLVPVINNLPNQIITNITPLENSYVTYGNSGGTEIYTIQALSKEFSNMTDLTAFMNNRLEANKTYEENIEIKIAATGNNKKTAQSIQNIKFIRGVKVTNETELNTALTSTSPSYIQIVDNIECDNTISLDGITHKIDLNNFMVSKTVKNESFTFITLGSNTNLTILDLSSEKQGKIIAKLSEPNNDSASGDDRLNTIYTINNQGTLNIESGIVASDLVQKLGELKTSLHVKSLAKTIKNSGTVNLNGGNITSDAVTQGVSYAATRNGEATAIGIENTGTVNLNNGNITCYAEGNMKKTLGTWGETRAYAYGVTNSGGTVNKSENVSISVTAIANEEGSYTETVDSAEIKQI